MLPHLRVAGGDDGAVARRRRRAVFFEKRCPRTPPGMGSHRRWRRGARRVRRSTTSPRSCGWPTSPRSSCTPPGPGRAPEHPTSLVFDLDPGAPADVLDCCRVALDLRRCSTSSVWRPWSRHRAARDCTSRYRCRGVTADDTKRWARALGQLLAKQDPERVTVDMERSCAAEGCSSTGARTTGTRRRCAPTRCEVASQPTVSTPLAWDEVEAALEATIPTRSRSRPPRCWNGLSTGDLYEPNLAVEQGLPHLG